MARKKGGITLIYSGNILIILKFIEIYSTQI